MGIPITRGMPQGPAEVYRKLLNWWPAPAATTKTLLAMVVEILQ